MARYEESSIVELKRELTADCKKEIVALANTDGGTLYVGVDNSGNVVGVAQLDDVMAQLGNMIRDGIKPDLTAYTSIEAVEDEGMKTIKLSVLRGTKRPYHLTDKGLKPSGVFIRHGVSSVPATDEVIRQMLRESDGVAFDKSRCLNQELTFSYTAQYFADNDVSFTESNMRSLHLVDEDGYYTNAALLLSDQCEHSIKCAVYEGVGKTKFKARKEFFGCVLKQMEDAFEYISLNNNQNSTFDGLKRIDRPDYPPYAIREALLNSISHRDYDYSGSTIINMYDDRVEFVSLGGLVKGLTIQDILGGGWHPKNMIIANVFYRLELIESYGTGIRKIMESYEGSVRKPAIQPAPASFVVTLPKLSNGETLSQEEQILRLIAQQGQIARKDVEMLLDVGKFPAINLLNQLLADGKIAKTGTAKAVRYQLKGEKN